MVVYAVRGSVVIRPLRGAAPGISKGCPLRYAFADFSRKRKVSASVGGTSPRNQKFDESYYYKEVKHLYTLP